MHCMTVIQVVDLKTPSIVSIEFWSQEIGLDVIIGRVTVYILQEWLKSIKLSIIDPKYFD